MATSNAAVADGADRPTPSDPARPPFPPPEADMLTWMRWEIRFDDVVRWGIAPHVHYDLNPYWN